jgi:hypothetical protein
MCVSRKKTKSVYSNASAENTESTPRLQRRSEHVHAISRQHLAEAVRVASVTFVDRSRPCCCGAVVPAATVRKAGLKNRARAARVPVTPDPFIRRHDPCLHRPGSGQCNSTAAPRIVDRGHLLLVPLRPEPARRGRAGGQPDTLSGVRTPGARSRATAPRSELRPGRRPCRRGGICRWGRACNGTWAAGRRGACAAVRTRACPVRLANAAAASVPGASSE